MAESVYWEIHRPRGGTWSCPEDEPAGFSGDDLARLRELRQSTPENTITKVKLSANQTGGRLYVFEFRWWRGSYDTRPSRAAAVRRALLARDSARRRLPRK